MFLHTVSIEHIGSYRLHVTFNNGESGEVDLSAELWGEMFEPLKEVALFASARQHPVMGTVAWANGADLAPEFILDLMHRQAKRAA